MSSITFYFSFVPLLVGILMSANFILAPHNPYKEKSTPFECGIHSFLAQNRTQFTIIFFIFGLLFLLFDLEILLAYPFTVSSKVNFIYGLLIFIVFVLILTLGFVFEFGKDALKIEVKKVMFPGPGLVFNKWSSVNFFSINLSIIETIYTTICSIFINVWILMVSNLITFGEKFLCVLSCFCSELLSSIVIIYNRLQWGLADAYYFILPKLGSLINKLEYNNSEILTILIISCLIIVGCITLDEIVSKIYSSILATDDKDLSKVYKNVVTPLYALSADYPQDNHNDVTQTIGTPSWVEAKLKREQDIGNGGYRLGSSSGGGSSSNNNENSGNNSNNPNTNNTDNPATPWYITRVNNMYKSADENSREIARINGKNLDWESQEEEVRRILIEANRIYGANLWEAINEIDSRRKTVYNEILQDFLFPRWSYGERRIKVLDMIKNRANPDHVFNNIYPPNVRW